MAEKYVAIAEVKDMLQKESDRREIGYEQRLALEHAQMVARVSAANAKKLMKELKALTSVELDERLCCKITDIMPKTAAEVRAVFAKEAVTIDRDAVEDIIKLVDTHSE